MQQNIKPGQTLLHVLGVMADHLQKSLIIGWESFEDYQQVLALLGKGYPVEARLDLLVARYGSRSACPLIEQYKMDLVNQVAYVLHHPSQYLEQYGEEAISNLAAEMDTVNHLRIPKG